MYLKPRTRTKDGKTHTYYAVCESVRVSPTRVTQRQILHLGELNTTQLAAWQRTLAVLHEDGQRHQLRLFTDRHGPVPTATDAVTVKLSTLAVKAPRRFGDCWAATQLWAALGLDTFWQAALADRFLGGLAMPGRALDLLDLACARTVSYTHPEPTRPY